MRVQIKYLQEKVAEIEDIYLEYFDLEFMSTYKGYMTLLEKSSTDEDDLAIYTMLYEAVLYYLFSSGIFRPDFVREKQEDEEDLPFN